MSNRILRNFLMIGLAASLGAVGCGSDDDGGGSGGSGGTAATGGGGTGGGTGGAAGSSTGGAAGSSTGGAAGSGTGGAAGSGTGGAAGSGTGGAAGSGTGGAAGGGGAAGAGNQAQAFCEGFNTTCKFSDTTYKNMNDCKTKFEAYSATRQACVVQHLGLAATDTATHCPHAAGAGPCAAN